MVYSTRLFVLCLTLCYFVLVFFSPFSIAITSLGEERANLSAFRTFVRFVHVRFCQFPLLLGVWEGLRFVNVAFPGLFSYPFVSYIAFHLSLFVLISPFDASGRLCFMIVTFPGYFIYICGTSEGDLVLFVRLFDLGFSFFLFPLPLCV